MIVGRPARFDEAAILEGARRVSAEIGPQRLTIAAVAERSGAPVGSIYHRYSSRDEILAALWLELAEKFQARFLSALDGPDPVRSGLAAVRYVCGWVREHPHESRLLLLHRREDFASDRWPAGYHRRARTLANRAESSLRAYARRLCDRAGGPELRAVRFALVDLPTAALRRDLEAGVSPSRDVQRRLLETCAFTLRRIARRRTMPGRRT